MTTTEHQHNVVLSTHDYDVVGTRPIRHDGADKVTGRALYGADFQAAGLLHGGILRSPHAHARIKSIDLSRAAALPGIRAFVTAKDLPETAAGATVNYGEGEMDLAYLQENVLARDKALYAGHAIVGVAGTSPHVVDEALGLIDVEYELLPPVLTAPEAMKEDAPVLLEGLRTAEFGQQADGPSNVAEHFQHSLGDVEEGFKQADLVIEREFNTATVHQGYVEPQNVTALWNSDGRLHIWTSTQGPFEVRGAVAGSLGIAVSRVKVTPMEIGGGFGGKFPLYHDPVAALKELAEQLNGTGGPIVGRAAPSATGVAFAGCIADVKVDPETGKVDVLRFTMAQDAGKAIHPSYVEGQMQSGAVQGIGWALNEECCISEDGRMMNSSLLDYRMPTTLDLPMIDTVILEVPNPGHPFGVRGVGEVSIVPPPAAIANAIHDAVGVRMDVLPMSSGAVMEAIWKRAK